MPPGEIGTGLYASTPRPVGGSPCGDNRWIEPVSQSMTICLSDDELDFLEVFSAEFIFERHCVPALLLRPPSATPLLEDEPTSLFRDLIMETHHRDVL